MNTLGELFDSAKKHPLAHGMRGIGDISHMTAELLKQLAPGFAPQYIPYSQMAQAVRDLMSGDLLMTMPLVTRTLMSQPEARGALVETVLGLVPA